MAVAIRRGALILLSASAIALVFIYKGPLQDVHWDAPIYLERGKEISETHYLRELSQHRAEIASSVPKVDGVGDFGSSFWAFMRLGNSMLLAGVVALTGHGMLSIRTAFWLYTYMWAIAVVGAGVLSYRLARTLAPELSDRAVVVGATVSCALYLASDVCLYMSGNFVAEVPAMLLLVSGAYALLRANEVRSAAVGVASGALAFVLYVVKMEGVWAYVSFYFTFGAALTVLGKHRLWWPAFLAAGVCAVALFAIYSWWFYPLTDPRLIAALSSRLATQQVPNSVAPMKLYVVAGGLLWLGLVPASSYCVRSLAIWVALCWLGIGSLPYVKSLVAGGGGQAQVRMFALVMPPLLLASTVGLAALFMRKQSRQLHTYTLPLFLAGAGALMMISHAQTYSLLREFPGGWRLHYVKTFLSPPPYERLNYPVDELLAISHDLESRNSPVVLIRDPNVPEEYLTIISYFGTHSVGCEVRWLSMISESSLGTCGAAKAALGRVYLMFGKGAPSVRALKRLVGAGGKILYLKLRNDTGVVPSGATQKIAFATEHLMLLCRNRLDKEEARYKQ